MFIDRKGESMETSVSNNPDDHLSFSNVSNLPATSVTYDFFRTELLLQEASVKHLQFFSECPCQGFIYWVWVWPAGFSHQNLVTFFFFFLFPLLYVLLQRDWVQFIFNLTCSCSKQQGMTFKYKILCYVTSLLNCLHFKFRNCNRPNARITFLLLQSNREQSLVQFPHF